MRFLMLCEGDPETRDSWSGSSNSIVKQLRAMGHTVRGGDADLYGLRRFVAAALRFAPTRQRWRVKYHLGAPAFFLRSRIASDLLQRHAQEIDVVLQTGAMFLPRGEPKRPLVLCCDSNIAMAERGRRTGYSYAASLTPDEVRVVHEREASVYREATLIFTLSEGLRQSFIQDFGVEPDRVCTSYAGPNLDQKVFPETASPRAEEGDPSILFVGREFERKGGDWLLEAFARVRARVPRAKLVVVGPTHRVEGPGVDWIGGLDPDDPVELDRLISLYRQSDVFCVPTRYEPFGVVYVEAMHFGLPCVGTAVDAVPEIVEDGETGFLVPPGDVEALSDRLTRLLSDRDRAHEMGSLGMARARRLFTWEAVVQRLVGGIERVVSGTADSG